MPKYIFETGHSMRQFKAQYIPTLKGFVQLNKVVSKKVSRQAARRLRIRGYSKGNNVWANNPKLDSKGDVELFTTKQK